MVIASGIGAQLGIGEEGSYGTYQAPTRFLPFERESISLDIGKLRSAGIGLGRFHRTNKVRTYVKGAKGSIEFIVENKGFGLMLKHCLGGVSSGNVGAVYTHTFTPDANALLGKYLTVQIGRPDVGGTSRPLSFLGGKVVSWELAAQLDNQVRLTPEFDFKSATTAQALAAASYAAAPVDFTFVDGALTYGGASKFVKSFRLRMSNGLGVDRRGLGNTKLEPLANALAEIEGEIACEWEDLDDYNAWLADTQAQLVATFTSPAIISGSDEFELIVTIPKIELLKAESMVEGPGVLQQPTPFKALYDGTNPIIEVKYITSDTAP